MNDYLKYQERLNELTKKKKEYNEIDNKFSKQRSKYVKYLNDNPYKKDLFELGKDRENKRQELMNLIPDNYANLKK